MTSLLGSGIIGENSKVKFHICTYLQADLKSYMTDDTFLISCEWPKHILSTCSATSLTNFCLHLTQKADENESDADKNGSGVEVLAKQAK